MKLVDFLAAARRYRRTFAITVGAVLVLGLAWLFLTPAEYVSTTRLMVSVEGSTTADAYQNDDVVAKRINTYIGLLTSDVVNQRVINELKLHETPRELAAKVNATAVQPRTSLIDIQVTDSSAERAQQIAQTLADQFVLFADAVETPTGRDGQKVHTTVVTSATPPQGNGAVRAALAGFVALAALLLGACAVWIRSARDPDFQLAGQTVADPLLRADVEFPPDTLTPPRPPARQPVPEFSPATEPNGQHGATPTTDAPSSEPGTSVPKASGLVETFRQLRARLGTRTDHATDRPSEATAGIAPDESSDSPASTIAVPTELVAPTDGRVSAPHSTAVTDAPDAASGEAVTSDSAPCAPIDDAAPADDPGQSSGQHTTESDIVPADQPTPGIAEDDDSISHDDHPNGATPSGEQPVPVDAASQRTIDLGETYLRLRAGCQRVAAWAHEALRKRAVSQPVGSAADLEMAVHTEPAPRTGTASFESRERTPWLLGFLCLLTSFMPAYLVPAGPLKSNGSPAKLIAIMCFGLAILGFVFVRRTQATRTIQPGVILILLFFLLQFLVYGVGMIHPGNLAEQASRTRVLLNLLAYVGLTLFILLRVHTARQRKIILGCLAVGLAYNCVVGLLQSMTNIDLRMNLIPPGFVMNTEDLNIGTREGVKRVLGTTLHAIEFSLIAAVAVPLAIYFAKYANSRWTRIGAWLLCILALISMPAAVSRTGVIGLAVALSVYMWCFTVRQIVTALVSVAAILAAYMTIAPSVTTALWATITGSRTDDSVAARLIDYVKVSRTFHEHPLFGLGLGGSPVSEYGLLDNEWLQALVQGGILGIAAMLILTMGGIFGFAAALRKAKKPEERNQAYALGSMFIGILVCSYFFDLFSFQQATRILFICFALMWSTYTIPLSEPITLDSGPPTPSRKPALTMKQLTGATSALVRK